MARSYRILVVDDERPMARALQLKLAREGYDVAVAFDGKQALEQVASKDFDLIILDLVMPTMDGFSVLKALEKENIPIVVSSNLSQREDMARVRALGASDYIVKSNTPLHQIVALAQKYLLSGKVRKGSSQKSGTIVQREMIRA